MAHMVRVEIHNGEYDRLHSVMSFAGLSRFLTDDKTRTTYHAPTGTYWMESSLGIDAVFELVRRVALAVDNSAEIVVHGPEGFRFMNCREQYPLSSIFDLAAQNKGPATPSLTSYFGIPEKPNTNQYLSLLTLHSKNK